VVTGRSLVETSQRHDSLRDPGASWESMADDATCDQHDELLTSTRFVPYRDERVLVQARELRAAGTPHEAAMAASAWVKDTLGYEQGITRVSTSAVEAWDERRGVCQDFAHLTLAMLRAMGIPCRYVSGYLHPQEDALVGTTVAGQSHAWVEWWAGEWVRFDPTNGIPVGQRHVVVGRGRDYGDVSPLKGIYSGGAAGDLEVKVELTRVA
jgi:transglutaminase-like putative cysteine protease